MEVNLKTELRGGDFVPASVDTWTVTNISFTGGTVELISLYSTTMHSWHGRELEPGTPLIRGAEIEGIHSSFMDCLTKFLPL